MEFKRNCPECGIEIIYTNKKYFEFAIKRNSGCKSCAKKNKTKEF